MKLVVGLGNPGRKYIGTRHNVGYMALAELAKRHARGAVKNKFEGELAEADLDGTSALLLSPLTFMNRSGISVLAARDFYKIPEEEILIVCDDFNLPLARLRLRPKGSAGGQRGLEDILHRLGSQDIPRLRIGIGPVPPRWDPADFVLGRFTKEQQEEIEPAIAIAADAVEHWSRLGVESAMSEFNSRVDRL